ncbi:MAG: hypothetical protein ACHQU8_03170 [Gemmatimonadales bacterium]
MSRSRPLVLTVALALLSLCPAGLAVAQEPQPAPAPAAAPPAAAAAPAVDSNTLYVGDWVFTAQLRDNTIDGTWRINYANGRFTGVVTIPGEPAPSPISQMSVRDHFRNVRITAYFNSEEYTFTGRLDNPVNINGTLQTRNGIGRMRAQKRG